MGSNDALPDDILERVFLSLHSPLWLLRAASTCKRWRRVISSADFPCRFRALHNKLLVAGSYYNQGKNFVLPRFEPSPSAAVDGRHFSLDFLPGHEATNWIIKDSRGSFLLLYREDLSYGRHDLVVCEPLTRRHVVIPPLAPSSAESWSTKTVLLDGEDGDSNGGGVIGMSNFRVLCLQVETVSIIHTWMFTSASSSWRGTSIDMRPGLYYYGVAAERRYWHNWDKRVVVALDQSTLESSSFVLPDDDDIGNVIHTVGRDGEARVVVVETVGNNLKIFARARIQGGGGEEWALEKTIQVSAAMLGLPQLERFSLSWHLPMEVGKVKIQVPAPGRAMKMRFLLDMDTMEAERLLGRDVDYLPDYDSRKAYPFEFPWPPSLRACCPDNQVIKISGYG